MAIGVLYTGLAADRLLTGAVRVLVPFAKLEWLHTIRAVKRCPDCAEEVQDGARVCRYCGFRFAPVSSAGDDDPPAPYFDPDDPDSAGARESDEQPAGGCGCGTLIVLVMVGCVLYFGFGVGRDHSNGGSKVSQPATADPASVSCKDLGIDNPDAPGGEDLKPDGALGARVAQELGEDAFGSEGSEEERTEAMVAALAFACVTADSPKEKPAGAALEFAKAAADGPGSETAVDPASGSCVILANGNKLCGEDARVWCDANLANLAGTRGFDTCQAVLNE